MDKGKLLVVGLGPGDHANLTYGAQAALSEAEVVVGYKAYVELARNWIPATARIEINGMTQEIDRAKLSIEQAKQGRCVALVCSGDSGVYALAGLVLELLAAENWQPGDNPVVEIIPGVSAVNSCAALLGAPLMHDYCTLNLSDLLTSWSVIRTRIEAAAQADFVIAFYNPRSSKRVTQLEEARQILLQYRSPNTPVGIVRKAYREGQFTLVTTLEKLPDHLNEVEMNTTVIVGNSNSYELNGLIITPRGYDLKTERATHD